MYIVTRIGKSRELLVWKSWLWWWRIGVVG